MTHPPISAVTFKTRVTFFIFDKKFGYKLGAQFQVCLIPLE
jgi:hypothetical protein